MRKQNLIFFIILFSVLTVTVFAQNQSGNLARFTILAPKAGMERQFEDGYKRHLEWHKTNGDTWNWYGWFVTSGTRRGQFIDATFGRTWADFDKPVNPSADRADNQINVLPFAENTAGYTAVFMPQVSRAKDADLSAPMQRVFYLKLHAGSEGRFNQFLAEFSNQVARDQSFLWYRIEDGDDVPQYFVMLPHNSFGEFEKTENLFERVLEKSETARNTLKESVREMRVETMRFRADLTYLPKKQ